MSRAFRLRASELRLVLVAAGILGGAYTVIVHQGNFPPPLYSPWLTLAAAFSLSFFAAWGAFALKHALAQVRIDLDSDNG